MKAAIAKILTFTLALSFLLGISSMPAQAATGDSDTFFNLETNSGTPIKYAVATYSSGFVISSAITIEAWLYPTNNCVAAIFCHIVRKEDGWTIAVADGKYKYALNGAAGGWGWIDTTITPRLNEWQHVALVRENNASTVSFYLNGQLVYTGSSGAVGSGTFKNSSYNFALGAMTNDVNNINANPIYPFIGSIDEIKIWQTARTQAQIISDAHSYGPTNDANLKMYYDFNDVSGTTLVNRASGADSSTNLTLKNSPTFGSIETSTVSAGRKTVTFPRTYISANGWKPPLGISSISILSVGGGGGGGNNVGNGGGGGGGYLINNLPVNSSSSIAVKVGTGGAGGRREVAGTLTYDGTTLIDGQRGDSSVATVDANSFIGGGGGGGDTIWSNNLCVGSGQLSLGGSGGIGVGSGGTAFTGGAGGALSGTQSVANGASGFLSSITGTSAYYGSGGGAAGWSSFVQGLGANSQGGNGNGSNGLNKTGSGGGGNTSGCAVGGNGGSGVVIFSFSAYGGIPTVINSAVYRTPTTITATVSEAGKVTFYASGKVIPGCKSKSTVSSSSITATCQWRPSQRNYVPITAKFAPTASPANLVTIDFGTVRVSSRSGQR
jgi:hypothetical protein